MEKEWYFVKVEQEGSFSLYEEWWKVHKSFLPPWGLRKIFPMEKLIKDVFDRAKRERDHALKKYEEEVKRVLRKHKIQYLNKASPQQMFRFINLLPEKVKDEVLKIDIPKLSWEDYVPVISKGKVQRLHADIVLTYEII